MLSSSPVWHGVLCQASTLCSWSSVVALLGQPHHDWSIMSVFTSLNCFTTVWHCWHPCRHLCTHEKVTHRYPSWPVLLHKEYNHFMLTKHYVTDSHLSQWIVWTLVVLMCQICIHIGKDTCCHIPCCTIYNINTYNLTILMTGLAIHQCQYYQTLWIWEHFPPVLCSYLQCQMCSVRISTVRLKDSFIRCFSWNVQYSFLSVWA
jgi:hypothetical protein